MTANRSQVIEYPHPEGDDGGYVQRHSKLGAEVGETRRQDRVGHEPAEEDARLERAGDVGLECSKDVVERGEQGDRCVSRVDDRNRERRHQAEHDAKKRKQNRDDDYLQKPHQLRGLAATGVPADSRRSRRVRGAFWRGPLICKWVPVMAKAEARRAMAKGMRAGATCSPRPAPPGSLR